jgi:hypothetical protein
VPKSTDRKLAPVGCDCVGSGFVVPGFVVVVRRAIRTPCLLHAARQHWPFPPRRSSPVSALIPEILRVAVFGLHLPGCIVPATLAAFDWAGFAGF